MIVNVDFEMAKTLTTSEPLEYYMPSQNYYYDICSNVKLVLSQVIAMQVVRYKWWGIQFRQLICTLFYENYDKDYSFTPQEGGYIEFDIAHNMIDLNLDFTIAL